MQPRPFFPAPLPAQHPQHTSALCGLRFVSVFAHNKRSIFPTFSLSAQDHTSPFVWKCRFNDAPEWRLPEVKGTVNGFECLRSNRRPCSLDPTFVLCRRYHIGVGTLCRSESSKPATSSFNPTTQHDVHLRRDAGVAAVHIALIQNGFVSGAVARLCDGCTSTPCFLAMLRISVAALSNCSVRVPALTCKLRI